LASFLVGQKARCCFWFGAFLGIICPANDDLQKHLKRYLEVLTPYPDWKWMNFEDGSSL
jgi:hypothetical protein